MTIFNVCEFTWLRGVRHALRSIYLILVNGGRRPYLKPFNFFDFLKIESDILFIHIPKVAGTSIAKAIYDVESYQHASVQEYLRQDEMRLRSKFVFSVVRNPYYRLWSAYCYIKRGGGSSVDKVWNILYLRKYSTFEGFVLEGLMNAANNGAIHFIPQFDFLSVNGTLFVECIGRVENLNSFYKELEAKEGKFSELPLLNVNPNKSGDIDEEYTSEMRAIVNDVYHQDFINFGYEKIT